MAVDVAVAGVVAAGAGVGFGFAVVMVESLTTVVDDLQAAMASIATRARSLTVFKGEMPPLLLSVCHKRLALSHFDATQPQLFDLFWR